MSEHEIEEIVRLVGDELLAKLGHPAANGRQSGDDSCACGHTVKTPPAAAPVATLIPGVEAPCPDWKPPKHGIAALIDHTLLRPEATELEIVELCAQARKHGFATVCVQPAWVARAVGELRRTPVKTCTVIGFPHGASLTPVKCAEAEQAIKLGAEELDMVMNVGALKSGGEDLVYTDIRCVTGLAHRAGAVVKVILEMGSLGEQEKITACVLAKLAAADFVKTSTGFGAGGAEPADVALMHRIVGGKMGIKAAGGVSSYERMDLMMRSGATRIGTSAGVRIVEQAAAQGISVESSE